MKLITLVFVLLTFVSAGLQAKDCREDLHNADDTIVKAFSCQMKSITEIDGVEDTCLIVAKTKEGHTYTQVETWAFDNNGWKQYFSTFKWHHRKNDSVSKMYNNKKRLKMKDISILELLISKLYKVAEFNKKTNELKLSVYKKNNLGFKKRYWYQAELDCQKFEITQ